MKMDKKRVTRSSKDNCVRSSDQAEDFQHPVIIDSLNNSLDFIYQEIGLSVDDLENL